MLSIFGKGDQKKQVSGTGGPVVRKVMVKKPIPPKPPGQPGASRPSTSASTSTSSGSGYKNESTSTSDRPRVSSTKGKERQQPPSRLSKVQPSTPSKRPIKRKVESSRIESESESDSGSGSSVDSDPAGLFGSASKLKSTKKAKLRNGHAQSSSSTPRPMLAGEEYVGKDRNLFRPRGETEKGEWEGFVPGEEIVRGVRKGWEADGEDGRVRSLLDKYAAYFPQEGFEKQDPLPFVELQYPAVECREKFYLLNPTAAREYAPLRELRTTIQQILDFYIPPSHRHIFGSLSDSLDLDSPSISRFQSPAPAAFPTPPPSGDSPHPAPVTETIGDAIRKALAPNRRDGPGFMKAMERFNLAMQDIQSDGSMANWLETRGKEVKGREWAKLVDIVHDQAYARVVGPYSHELEHHPKHPDEVAVAISAKEDAYGELRHDFMTKVIEQTGLGPSSVFVDLGSGVGNCVTQVALQAGSRSYGFELLPVPAHCARLQMVETKRRWAMWCLNGNTDIEAHEGDFRTIPDVAKRLRDADVVLVNNEVFPSSLNNDLTNMFLDLKDGAKIVSLKPFVPEGFRMNESNCDSFAAIVKLATHHYAQGWVSWKGDSGRYYIQTIDRSARIKYEEKMNSRSRR